MASVELNHVDKVYEGNIKAVDDFNLQISDQEFVVFVGHSGCGKTTRPSGNQWVAHMDALQCVTVPQAMQLRLDMRCAYFFDTGAGEINLTQGNEFNQRASS